MKRLPFQKRTLTLMAILVPLFALFIYVAFSSGPLAPVPVVLATVENMSLSPALFGIGTVEARYTYKIGPTFAGRLKQVAFDVGDRVRAGQVIGEMDPVDLDERIAAQDAAIKEVLAQLREVQARKDYAQSQAQRYHLLLKGRATSEETAAAKHQELQVAQAALAAAQEALSRARAEREGLAAQRRHLLLIAPVDGLIVARDVDPGTTVVAGQAVVELIDPDSLWIDVRFDQIRAQGLAAGLPAQIVLRSRAGVSSTGRVLRVEPLADAVTEEILAKVVFEHLPDPLPPIGELAEVTVELPAQPSGPVIPNAAIQRIDGRLGVWQVTDGGPAFKPIESVASDLDGRVLVRKGLEPGHRVVAYSQSAISGHSRIHVVERLPGVAP
ncbi:efflux RND transporter periplasmic adaptor subunit [Desulfatitalea tepidiphila]|uniref:efflux RND transporter periplasmic adaptor subunit n=1 Tax=Desulfatitalea tepidiphila TaxID=1185843 RepID=UPI0006B618C8|nr:efflux RND transporter periplasmic adaptor subunit [Desulfatitalea tepidiphila]